MRARRPWDPCMVYQSWVGWTNRPRSLANTFALGGQPLHWVVVKGSVVVYALDRRQRGLLGWVSVPQFFWRSMCVSCRERTVRMGLTKVTGAPSEPHEPDDNQAKSRWPTLWEYLTTRYWDSAKKDRRQTSTITLFLRDDGRLCASLNDKENRRTCFGVSDTLLGLLDVLDGLADHADTVWREDKNQTGGSARRKA